MKMTTSRVGRRRAVDNNALQPVIRLLLFPQLRGHPGPATILKRIVLRTTVFSQRRTRESPNTTIIQAALSPLSLSFYRLPPLSSYMLFFWKTFKEPDRIVYVRSRAATRQMFGVVLAGLALILMPPNLVQHSAAFRRAAEQVPVLFFGPLALGSTFVLICIASMLVVRLDIMTSRIRRRGVTISSNSAEGTTVVIDRI